MKDLYIIDASGFIYRSYYAIQNMTNAEGKSTNALFGFIRSILKIFKDFETEHVVAVFDGPSSWKSRLDIYPEYKANRRVQPPDLFHQFDWAREYCNLMGIPYLNAEGVEADDAMASVALWAAGKGAKVYICSSDKDLCQLVSDSIFLVHTHKNNKIIGPEEVEETFGIPPDRIRDYLAIVGDASDNVPGIPGFGPKTAASLLHRYGTLDNLLEHKDDFSGKKLQALKENEDQAKISQQLVSIDTEVEFPRNPEFFKPEKPKVEELKQFFLHKNFRAFLKDLDEEYAPENNEKLDYAVVDDQDSLDRLVKSLGEAEEISFDTETTALHPMEAELVGIGFCTEEGKARYVPANGKLGIDSVLKTLKPLFENPKTGFYSHNVKYDYHVLNNYGIDIANICFDTLLGSYVLGAQQRQHSLDALSLERFGKVKTPITDLIGKGKNQIGMQDAPIEKVGDYCCEDVDYTLRLKRQLQDELSERNLSHILFDIELPLVRVLAKMERRGMFLDIPYLEKLSKEVQRRIEATKLQIFSMTGEEFNLNSPKQLSHILFEKMKIPPVKKTTTGFSTNAEVLESLRTGYPVVEHILDYRQLEKLRSTYIDALPSQVNPETHRLHCNFNQSATATGRLSSQDPNLQNIPARSEVGRKIRAAFKPEKPGWSYLSADYSQIELRLVAHMSDDPAMIKAFKNNEDIHKFTASLIFDVPLEEVTAEMRYRAKAVNFGIIYGQGEHGLAKQLGIKRKEAKEFIEKYFQRYSSVRKFVDECIEKSRETNKAVTMTARERAIPEISSKNQMIRSQAERLAVNTPLQGTAADLIKLAMLEIDRLFTEKEYPQFMISQIHDELLFEIPDHLIDEASPLIKKSMENVWELKIPLIVDIKVGKNWQEC
jgi:DNA polymerase I